jgi:hypothetical protein
MIRSLFSPVRYSLEILCDRRKRTYFMRQTTIVFRYRELSFLLVLGSLTVSYVHK